MKRRGRPQAGRLQSVPGRRDRVCKGPEDGPGRQSPGTGRSVVRPEDGERVLGEKEPRGRLGSMRQDSVLTPSACRAGEGFRQEKPGTIWTVDHEGPEGSEGASQEVTAGPGGTGEVWTKVMQ